MQSYTIFYMLISLKSLARLVIFCILFCCTSLSNVVAETIQPDKTINAQALSVRLTPKEKAWLENNQRIKVAVKNGWRPIEFKLENDEHQGLSMDYLTRLANLLQINFVIVDYTENISPEEADIISGVGNSNLKNNQFYLLNQPYLTLPLAIYTNKYIKKKSKIKGLEDLDNTRVAIFKGGALAQKISESYPKIKVVNTNVIDEAFNLLKSGTVDAYVGNEMLIDYHIALNGLTFVEKSGLTPFTSTVSMAVRKDEPELISIIEKGLLVLEPEKKELLDKWIIYDDKNEKIVTIALAFISIFVLLILIRFNRLKQTIKKQDIESQQKVWHQANFDYLTELPNRHLLHNRLTQALDIADRSKLPVGLLYIDLDNFKRVNDQSGHTVGDKLLIQAAKRISGCVRQADTTARIGGDEFMVIMSELKDNFSLEKTCQKIIKEIEKPFFIDGNMFHISASIGVTTYPDDGQNSEGLLVHADQAMYEAKKLGRNRYQFFTQSMQTASLNKLSINNDLRNAMAEGQFAVYYQPIINLKDLSITKAEALIRWNHPTKGIISPAEFIPIAEEIGLINELGQWVFHQAIKDLCVIRSYLGSDFQLSINVSPYQFNHSDNLLIWLESISKLGIPGNCLSLEITEGLLLEASNTVLTTLSKLQSVGIELSIDDFGTGYSALAYLKKFDIDYVKIDKSFIQNLASNNNDAVLCEAMIYMAHKLNIKVIAEGIETEAQKNLLQQFECGYGQGYLFAIPATLEQLLTLLPPLKTSE